MSKFFDDKLKTLKQNRIANLEKKLLVHDLRGYEHYVFINDNRKAQVITNGKWVTENIRTIDEMNAIDDKIQTGFGREWSEDDKMELVNIILSRNKVGVINPSL